MEILERKIPPVAVFIIFIVAMVKFDQSLLGFAAEFPLPWWGLAVSIVLSGVIGVAGVNEFRKAKTTVNPVKVDSASTVVDSGIFAYSRNPMYLALLILLVGIGYWQQNIICLLLPIGFVLYMNRFQIAPEERALEALFGVQYIDYKNRVRRWI
ncbi:isoprenylcysteine carboxylmethyltransferase family protein [Vibrio sp. 404]|uniref:Isoprenylcysteine carboxylmethyltransferase family protein n=1 Tax=Vibrio marinisediminis TaxID=2758441 RepID=A0A7W2ITX5_9VIBR|nr:isoprenylcysteine carboxylmethyltransferase family protein [Vibrio marinisediminis]MBA5763011.1 isoprenylcysteine carboxylmethyltransferase family protein [Vibrio marinisediminis]